MSMLSVYVNRNCRIRKRGIAVDYVEYLTTPLWASIRERVLVRDGRLCRICGETATQAHHTNYTEATLSGRSLVGLFAICRTCHKFIEFNQNGSKAHLFKEVRKRILLLARLNGREFVWPSQKDR